MAKHQSPVTLLDSEDFQPFIQEVQETYDEEMKENNVEVNDPSVQSCVTTFEPSSGK